MTHLNDFFSGMQGRRIPGGCEECQAYQTVVSDGRLHRITVHHDNTCPTYRAMKKENKS